MSQLKIVGVFIGGVLLAAGAFGVYAAIDSGGGSNSNSVQNVSDTATTSATTSGSDSSNASLTSADCMSAADIYEQVRPSVVEIDVQGTTSNGFGSQGFSGTGSGIVLDDSGNILTNNHVVENADKIAVKFDDGSTVEATVAGTDSANDLAVVKVNPSTHDLKPAKLGDSAALRVGDPVLAIGNPFNLEGTMTEGIVSALNRSYAESNGTRPIRGMVQTDAAINPGNSGGPLLNCQGEVIGINTLLDNPTGQSVNVGVAFSVSINTAKSELDRLQGSQTVEHAWLGIAGADLTQTLASSLNLSVSKGVYVTTVDPSGPSKTAGVTGAYASQNDIPTDDTPLKSGGDVITKIDGKDVTGIEQLATYIDQNHKPGDKVDLTIVRNGSEQTITVTLANWPTT
ncbi:MAG: trypsin-like peptidase domain-containing protein [Chloroflexota bacterium]